MKRKRSLRGFDLIPDFVVLGAARNVLPKVDALHIGIGIVEMPIADGIGPVGGGASAGVRVVAAGLNGEGPAALPGKDAAHLPPCEQDRKSTRLNSSHSGESRMPSSA